MDPAVLAKYASPAGAASYNVKYERELHKRISNRVELKLLRRVFAVVGRRRRLLDLPSGTGRMFGEIGRHADRYVECDYSREMLKVCRANIASLQQGGAFAPHAAGQALPQGGAFAPHAAGPAFVTASCFAMPYRDGAFDCVFSARLMHHIPDLRERERFIAEMARVSSEWVVTTYFDTWSLKNVLRRLRRPFNRKKPKVTYTRSEIRAVAARHGLEWVADWPLSRLFSGHRYAVFRKTRIPNPKSQPT